jgi:glutathione S-transferase
LSDTLPRHLEYFAKVLAADASSPWLCGGASPTIADFYLATVVHNNFATKDWGTPVAIPRAVQANIDALYGLTAVKAFKAAEGKAK